MGRLCEKERELVALGAALGSNCIPCIVNHIAVARGLGMTDEQLLEAVELADRVRRVPAEQVLRTARAHIRETARPPGGTSSTASGCGC